MKYKVAHIIWRDISSKDGWHSVKKAHSVVTVHSVGFLVEDNEKDIVLSMALTDELDSGTSWTIPKSNIIKKKILK